jgi:putative membrane protein
MSNWVMSWVAFSLSVFIAARILPFVHIRSLWTAVGVAAVYGTLKFCLYWVLFFLSLPLILLTLGLFLLVLNAIFLWITDKMIDGFEIESFLHTLVTSAVISIFDLVLRWIIPGV